jgi:hypothetical protein
MTVRCGGGLRAARRKIAPAAAKPAAYAAGVTLRRTSTVQKKGSRNPLPQSKPVTHHNFPSAEIAGQRPRIPIYCSFVEAKAPVTLQKDFASRVITIP